VQRLSSFAAQTAACSSSACWLVILIGAGSSEVGARLEHGRLGRKWGSRSSASRIACGSKVVGGRRPSAWVGQVSRKAGKAQRERKQRSERSEHVGAGHEAGGARRGLGAQRSIGIRREAKLSRAQACSLVLVGLGRLHGCVRRRRRCMAWQRWGRGGGGGAQVHRGLGVRRAAERTRSVYSTKVSNE
jgi:hypothetical protein